MKVGRDPASTLVVLFWAKVDKIAGLCALFLKVFEGYGEFFPFGHTKICFYEKKQKSSVHSSRGSIQRG